MVMNRNLKKKRHIISSLNADNHALWESKPQLTYIPLPLFQSRIRLWFKQQHFLEDTFAKQRSMASCREKKIVH